ncbi:MAG TPA: ABC transporter substrate-binding protein [Candidatus Limiplasma sp.]|nr:ABC transporter substrate-binding protein [Candidatus Limiplasma sp.]
MRKRIALILVLLAGLLLFSACGSKEKTTLTIAEQFGIAYAPLQVMKDEGILEQALPDVEINWVQLGGPTAIREGMLAGNIDLGFMGVGPMLLGVDTGMDWKAFTALSANEVSFITNRDDIQSLADISADDRIAVISPGCTQHILLCLAAEQQFGEPDRFDEQLVSLSHPDAMSAMLAGGEIVLHITTPPYADLELQNGMHKILTGQDVMGGSFTFICGVAKTELYDDYRGIYDTFQQCLSQAIDEINADLEAAAEKLAPVYGVDADMLYSMMSYNGTIYSKTLTGVDKLAAAMVEMGLLSKAPTAAEYAFADVEVAP